MNNFDMFTTSKTNAAFEGNKEAGSILDPNQMSAISKAFKITEMRVQAQNAETKALWLKITGLALQAFIDADDETVTDEDRSYFERIINAHRLGDAAEAMEGLIAMLRYAHTKDVNILIKEMAMKGKDINKMLDESAITAQYLSSIAGPEFVGETAMWVERVRSALNK